ncbi:MAG: DUF2203 domain-containing protein [Thermoanaerobaculia bacterium]|nr:DUF2203 domain-containing protein [Thermoanaerobaculia bacterium]
MSRTGRVFSYDEALSLFPAVRERTAAAVREIDELAAALGTVAPAAAEIADPESAFKEVVDRWTQEIESLGCEVKGLWLVDWDAGDGYFCWRHPEPALAHFHGYDEGFAGRLPIA